MEYFCDCHYEDAKKERNKMFIVYFSCLFVYLVLGALAIFWNTTLPYESGQVLYIRIALYSVTAIFIVFSYLYMGVKFSVVNAYYKLLVNLKTGLREESKAVFLENDPALTIKDGVDMKSLVFLEWNERKEDYFERKVLVFNERPFPEIPEKATVKFVTQGNVLINYEIESLDETEEN